MIQLEVSLFCSVSGGNDWMTYGETLRLGPLGQSEKSPFRFGRSMGGWVSPPRPGEVYFVLFAWPSALPVFSFAASSSCSFNVPRDKRAFARLSSSKTFMQKVLSTATDVLASPWHKELPLQLTQQQNFSRSLIWLSL